MTRKIAGLATSLLVVCVFSSPLLGAGARFWEVATLADFLEGEVTNLSIDLHGRLVLGPELTELAAPTAPVLWNALEGRDGALYMGTGNDGQVLRIAPDGQLSVYFDSAELEVHALAMAPNGTIYAGTSPDGRIYRLTGEGQATPFFDPDDKYIWALAVGPDGAVYAATGDKGLVYRITPDGQGEVFYSTRATHVRALHVARDGSLLVGTESPGRVFRVTPDGQGFLLLDSGLQEISAIRPGRNGVVYAAALTASSAPEPSRPTTAPEQQEQRAPVPTVSAEITSMAVVEQPPPAPEPSRPAREAGRSSGRGAVYRIQPDGDWDPIWSSAEDTPYDVALDTDGAVLVATGGQGKIYRVYGDPARTMLLARAAAQQVMTLVPDGPRGLVVATANPAKVFRLSARPAETGTYESTVRDAQSIATWGAISWRGLAPAGTDVRLYTRAGNTPAPDETWSPWSEAYRNPDGEQITSPRARYLQWKLELVGTQGRTPVVTSVTAAYLQRNVRPEITGITIHPPGVVFQKPYSSGETEIAGFDAGPLDRRPGAGNQQGAALALGRRGYQKGLQTIIWKAQDENEDDLSYDVLYRREGETSWKILKENLLEPIFVWDTTSVPNGTYVVKIVATDALANPPGSALVAERESGLFDIDNTPPTITVLSAVRSNNRTSVRFVVRDFDSTIQRVEYAIDADRWRPIYPKDGIADTRVEEFELTLEVDTVDKAIILRAVDAMNNVATGRAEPLEPQN
ncbi:MAG TPA: hypothetical protein VF198_17915 [Vicinamibacterales bacterium]